MIAETFTRASLRAAAPLLAATVLAGSCGIFDAREPNPPGGDGSTPRQSPVNANAVVFNFTNAVAYMDQGQYEEALAADFEFTPDEADRLFFLATVGADVFEDWGRDAEMTAIQKIFSESESLTVSFDEVTRQEWPDSALVRLDYAFRRRIARSGMDDSVATFKGFAEIHLRADNSSFWSIDEWVDTERSTDFLTWGRLKGSTASGGAASARD